MNGGWGDEPSILIFADGEEGRAAAIAAAQSVGARVIGAEPTRHALDRLGRQASVDSVLIELDGTDALTRDRLVDWANHAVRDGITSAVISIPHALIDDVSARLDESRIDLLCDAGIEERAAALSFALAQRRHKLHDHASKRMPSGCGG